MQADIAVHDMDQKQGNPMNSSPNRCGSSKKKQMSTITKATSVAVLFALGLALAARAAEPSKPEPKKGNNATGAADFVRTPQQSIGFRGDGTGVIPGNNPPTDFDAFTGKNLRWKADLPNFSSGAPTVVGDRVFVACTAGWPEGQDCAVLLCYDLRTGKERWRHDLDEFAPLAEPDAAAARAARKTYYERVRAVNRLRYEYKTADEARRTAILAEMAALGVKAGADIETDGRWSSGTTEQLLKAPDLAPVLRKVRYDNTIWGPTCLDLVMPAPTSDGTRVVAFNGRRSVHCFDLDGRVLWQVRLPDVPTPKHWTEDLANAPVIVDGKYLMHVLDHLWAFDLKSGELVWAAESKQRFRHGMGSPVLLRLKVPGSDVKTEHFLYLWTGDLVRLRDGKIMQRSLIYPHFPNMTTDRADTLFITALNAGTVEARLVSEQPQIPLAGRGGVRAIRFTYADAETVTWKELWFNPGVGIGSYPIYHEGRIYCDGGQVLDAATGGVLAPGTRGGWGANGIVLAGGHFYGCQDAGVNEGSGGAGGLGIQKDRVFTAMVVRGGRDSALDARRCNVELLPGTITDPAKRAQVVALTGLDRHRAFYGWSTGFPSPSVGGDCFLVRTFNTLYCFGHRVQGGPGDDPAVVTALRAETDAAKLAARLGDPSAQYRYEAVERLGALKAPLVEATRQRLEHLLVNDPYEEIRAAAMLALDACDPAGEAGWKAFVAGEIQPCYGTDLRAPPERVREQRERRARLPRLFRCLGQTECVALLSRRWPQAVQDPVQRRALLEVATALQWRVGPMLADVLAALRQPAKDWDAVRRRLPDYFAAVDAASDPATADILIKAYPQDWTLYPTFARNLTPERLLAWIEPIALASGHPTNRARILSAWRAVGPAALPSMERVRAAMAGRDPAQDKLAASYATDITEQIADMKGEKKTAPPPAGAKANEE